MCSTKQCPIIDGISNIGDIGSIGGNVGNNDTVTIDFSQNRQFQILQMTF